MRKASSSTLLHRLLNPHHAMYTEERLKPLKTYKYCGMDMSPISRYILSHYWNWAVTLFPLWMAPNLITLLGFGWMFAGLAVALIYVPDLTSVGPRWIYFFFALCLWVYSTLDNVDGKQARRTGSSSPLGELFDHGCDALNCSVGGVVQIAAMGLGSSVYSMLLLGITFWAFYLPTWEEYHTGVLYLGYINGPTEGLLLAIGMMLLSGIFGPSLWQQPAGIQFPSIFASTSVASLPMINLSIIFFFTIFLSIYVPTCLYSVYKVCKEKGKSFKAALLQLFPMFTVSMASCIWLWSSQSNIRFNGLFPLFILTFGIGFGKMATKIIYSHLTKRHFPFHSGLCTPLYLGAFLSTTATLLPLSWIWNERTETIFLLVWFIVSLIGYSNWCYHVINSFCSYLGIQCFTIKATTK